MKAQIPPVVSASAINAPPCIAPSVVHRDSSHANLAVTRDSSASRTWAPSKPTNGIVLANASVDPASVVLPRGVSGPLIRADGVQDRSMLGQLLLDPRDQLRFDADHAFQRVDYFPG